MNDLSFPKQYLGDLPFSIYGISSGSSILCKSSLIPIDFIFSQTV